MNRPGPAPMPEAVRATIDQLLASARSDDDTDTAWARLEDAHVLSQPWIRPHLRVHLAMLSLGWKQGNPGEVAGQLMRLALAGPGSALGRYPTGNTGRSNVSAFEPMPIRQELEQLLDTPDDDAISPRSAVLDPHEVQSLYDRVAPIYDIAAAPYVLFGGRRLAQNAIDELRIKPGATVIDLGTGTGWNLPHLSAAVGPTGHVIGVDISKGMLTRAQHRLDRHNITNVDLVEHDITTYQPPNPPDAIISTFAIEMLPDYDHIISRYIQTLAPGGRIATTGLRHPQRWPDWLITAGTAFMRIFGVSDAYRNHQPWETITANTDDTTYAERFAGSNYLAAGTRPDHGPTDRTIQP